MSNAPPSQSCVFCGSTEKKTHEHIWGDWLKDYVPGRLSKHGYSFQEIDRPGQTIPPSHRIRAGDPLNSQVKIVCAKCNNGWLSRIQQETKPILGPLTQGQPAVLGREAQEKLATWITMATITAEYLNYNPRLVTTTQDQRQQFMETGKPLIGSRIWLGYWEPNRLAQQWLHTSIAVYDEAELPNVTHYDGAPQTNTQVTTVRLGKLLFHVMSSTDPRNISQWDWRDDPRARRLLFPLWPIRHQLIAWPINGMLDWDVSRISQAYIRRLDAIATALGD